jgi:hypothetical protein
MAAHLLLGALGNDGAALVLPRGRTTRALVLDQQVRGANLRHDDERGLRSRQSGFEMFSCLSVRRARGESLGCFAFVDNFPRAIFPSLHAVAAPTGSLAYLCYLAFPTCPAPACRPSCNCCCGRRASACSAKSLRAPLTSPRLICAAFQVKSGVILSALECSG